MRTCLLFLCAAGIAAAAPVPQKTEVPRAVLVDTQAKRGTPVNVAFWNSQKALLTNSEFLRAVLRHPDTKGLTILPKQDAAEWLVRQLIVEIDDKKCTLTLSIRAGMPFEQATLANAIADVYTEHTWEEAARENRKWVKDLIARIEASKKTVNNLNGMVDQHHIQLQTIPLRKKRPEDTIEHRDTLQRQLKLNISVRDFEMGNIRNWTSQLSQRVHPRLAIIQRARP